MKIAEFHNLPLINISGRGQGFVTCVTPDGRRVPKPAVIWADGWCKPVTTRSQRHGSVLVQVVALCNGVMDAETHEVLYAVVHTVYKRPLVYRMNSGTGELEPVTCPVTGDQANGFVRFASGTIVAVSEEIAFTLSNAI